MNNKIILSWSGGKDSALALYEIRKDPRYKIASLLTTITRDYDRSSLHGVRRVLLEKQAQSIGLPLEEVFIPRDCSNEDYGAIMAETLSRLQKKGVSAVAFGDIYLEDVRRYREDNLSLIGMEGLFPLWKKESHRLTRLFIDSGFKAIVTCIDSKALDSSFVGRVIDDSFLADLPASVDPAGENGEFHSFVFNGPIFKDRINFINGEVVLRDSFYFADLLPA